MGLLAGAALTGGCGGGNAVLRVVDGRPVPGPEVEVEAYAAYLRGTVALAAGDLQGAEVGFARARDVGGDDPEILTRLGEVACAREPRGSAAPDLFNKALRKDPAYAPAWAARAACAAARGDGKDALAAGRRAADLGGRGEVDAVLARLAAGPGGAPVRELLERRLLAQTLEAPQGAAAWDALVRWSGRGSGSGAGSFSLSLYAAALEELAVRAPPRHAELALAAVALEDQGQGLLAQRLARALATVRGPSGEMLSWGPELVARRAQRLAVEGILTEGPVDGEGAGGTTKVVTVAVATRTPLVEVAGRALLVGQDLRARALLDLAEAAGPDGASAALRVLRAALVGTEPNHETALATDGDPVPPAVWTAWATRVGTEGARRGLPRLTRGPLVASDGAVTAAAVDLAARGALPPEELPPDGKVELAVRRLDIAAAKASAADGTLDPRHRLLALSLAAPAGVEARTLAERLEAGTGSDGLLAVAALRIAVASSLPPPPAAATLVARRAPWDPLAASAALALARTKGDTAAVARARAYLAARGATAEEKAQAWALE